MFSLSQQVYLKTGFVFVAVFFLAQVGGLDGGAGLLWGLVAAITALFLLRQNLRVSGGPDVLKDKTTVDALRRTVSLVTSGTPPSATPAAPASDPQPAKAAVAQSGLPPRLSAPRGGTADDLKQISGVGPKTEASLHEMGYYHFDQIAAWTPEQAAQVDEALPATSGRAVRDNWVAQAQKLATDGA